MAEVFKNLLQGGKSKFLEYDVILHFLVNRLQIRVPEATEVACVFKRRNQRVQSEFTRTLHDEDRSVVSWGRYTDFPTSFEYTVENKLMTATISLYIYAVKTKKTIAKVDFDATDAFQKLRCGRVSYSQELKLQKTLDPTAAINLTIRYTKAPTQAQAEAEAHEEIEFDYDPQSAVEEVKSGRTIPGRSRSPSPDAPRGRFGNLMSNFRSRSPPPRSSEDTAGGPSIIKWNRLFGQRASDSAAEVSGGIIISNSAGVGGEDSRGRHISPRRPSEDIVSDTAHLSIPLSSAPPGSSSSSTSGQKRRASTTATPSHRADDDYLSAAPPSVRKSTDRHGGSSHHRHSDDRRRAASAAPPVSPRDGTERTRPSSTSGMRRGAAGGGSGTSGASAHRRASASGVPPSREDRSSSRPEHHGARRSSARRDRGGLSSASGGSSSAIDDSTKRPPSYVPSAESAPPAVLPEGAERRSTRRAKWNPNENLF